MNERKIFRAEVRCAFPEWGRYGVYMTAVCFDADGATIDYVNLADEATASPSTLSDTTLQTPPCDHADLYLYIVAREFPASTLISASPPFEVELLVTGGASDLSKTYSVNQWGGLSVKQSLV